MYTTYASKAKETKEGEQYIEYTITGSDHGTLQKSQNIQNKLDKKFGMRSSLTVDGTKRTFKIKYVTQDISTAQQAFDGMLTESALI